MVAELHNHVGSNYDYRLLVFIRLHSLNIGVLGPRNSIKLGNHAPAYSQERTPSNQYPDACLSYGTSANHG